MSAEVPALCQIDWQAWATLAAGLLGSIAVIYAARKAVNSLESQKREQTRIESIEIGYALLQSIQTAQANNHTIHPNKDMKDPEIHPKYISTVDSISEFSNKILNTSPRVYAYFGEEAAEAYKKLNAFVGRFLSATRSYIFYELNPEQKGANTTFEEERRIAVYDSDSPFDAEVKRTLEQYVSKVRSKSDRR